MFTKLLDKLKLTPAEDNLELIVDFNRVFVIRNKVITEEIELARSMRSMDVKTTPRAFKTGPDTVSCFTYKSIAAISEVGVKVSPELTETLNTVLGMEANLLTQRIVHMTDSELQKYDPLEREKHNFSYCINDTRDSVVLAYMFFKGIHRAAHSKFTGYLTNLEKDQIVHIPAPATNTNSIDFSELGLVATAMDIKEAERYFQLYEEKTYHASMLNLPKKSISIIDDSAFGVITNITKRKKSQPWVLYINTDTNKPIISYNTANVVRISTASFDSTELNGTEEQKLVQIKRLFEEAIKDTRTMEWDYVLLDDLSIDPTILPDAPTIVCSPNLRKELFLKNAELELYLKYFERGIINEGNKWGFLPSNLTSTQVNSMEVKVGDVKIPVCDLIEYTLRKYNAIQITPNSITPLILYKNDKGLEQISLPSLIEEVMQSVEFDKDKIGLPNLVPYMNKYNTNKYSAYHITDIDTSVTEIAKIKYTEDVPKLIVIRVDTGKHNQGTILKTTQNILDTERMRGMFHAIVKNNGSIINATDINLYHKTDKAVILDID